MTVNQIEWSVAYVRVIRPCFQQKHRAIGIFRDATGDDGAGTPGADDDGICLVQVLPSAISSSQLLYHE